MRHDTRQSRGRGWTAAALGVLLITGCDEGKVTMKPTITYVEADARVERLIQEATAQLPASAELKQQYAKALSCEGPNGLEDSGMVFAERSYEVVHPPSWPAEQLITILERFWQTRGYRVRRNDRNDPIARTFSVEDPADGTRIGVMLYPRQNGTTDVDLFGSSPCVWEFGTPSAQP